jgi:hypothetical protein
LHRAKRQLADVTGLKPEGVVRAARENGGWQVGLELLELSRIPAASDVLGEYEVILGEDGDMLRFERKRTRLRGETRDEES